MYRMRLLAAAALAVLMAMPAAAQYKWGQAPDMSETGVNVECCENGDAPYVLADDFLCTTTGDLTQICIWGSWAHDEPPLDDPTNVGFTLSIHSDIPDSLSPTGYSMPGECLWYHEFGPGEYTIETLPGVYKWWLSPGSGSWFPCCYIVYKYCFTLDETWTFEQQGTEQEPIVYWLDVQAEPMYELDKYWGWLSSLDHWNDDATWGAGGEPYQGSWSELIYPLDHPMAGESMDLAFEIEGEMPIGEDFGDAPDGPYPTYVASNGAMHPIIQGFQMGQFVDSELDGQPDPMAMGDDNANTDDEDGVLFSGPIMVGSSASVVVDLSASGTGGYIDAWIDFGNDGSWAEAGDQIIMSHWVSAGTAPTISFNVPPTAQVCQTYARFRLSSSGGLNFDGMAPDGEVEDYQVQIDQEAEEWKWEQTPDLGETGIDVNASDPYILADDFLCEAPGRLTRIDIWGSWLGDYIPFNADPLAVDFMLSIHEDIPASESPTGYSMPGEVLWYQLIPAGMFTAEVYQGGIMEGWMDPPDLYQFPADWTCWKYSFDLFPEEAFHQVGTPDSAVVYWLDVKAIPHDVEALFGWKTTLDHWNDDAVWGEGMEPYPGPWGELRYPPGHAMQGQSIDLAFRIGMDYGTDVPSGGGVKVGLRQNVPNPFNPKTAIHYVVPLDGAYVTLDVMDVSGRLVSRLVDGYECGGPRSVVWDGRDANGEKVASGVYFYRLVAGDDVYQRKMVLLK